ncbi:MAG TPA: acyl-CoA desaturase [Streptosporangiaceae bacterium]|nr:acyl-CoA desaturase [Streptosporangiaceae bacterium]
MQSNEVASAAARQPNQSLLAPAASSRGSDYSQLSRLIRQAGLMERRPGHCAWLITVTILLLAAGWAGFVLVGDSWWQLAVAAFLAIMFTQIGFLGHEAGHKQISRSRRASDVIGLLLGNLGIGLSYGWWVSKHNRHHAHPNTEGADPDLEIGVLAFTAHKAADSRGLPRFLFRYQAYLFFLLLFAEAVSLHVSSIRELARRSAKNRLAESALLCANLAGYLAVVFVVLPPVKAVVFIGVQQGLFGLYLGVSFAPNHKGMPILVETDQSDFLRRQVLTSRNVNGGWLTDLALGGLNYQIEHHLFPSMPRANLRRAQPIVRDYCRQRSLLYSQTSFISSYAQVLSHLHSVVRSAGLARGADPT